jgi:tetratricopeptide (TPR) repeat protein
MINTISKRDKLKNNYKIALLLCFVFFSAITFSQPPNSKGPQPHEIVTDTNKVFKGNTYALIIGVNKYKESVKYKVLNHSIDDAISFKQFLQSKAGGNVPEENIMFYTDSEATTGKILRGLSEIKRKPISGDRVFIYFSGHGLTANEGTDAYILLYDADKNLNSIDIYKQMGTIPLFQTKYSVIKPIVDRGVQVFLVIDACRSIFSDNTLNKKIDSLHSNEFISSIISSSEMDVGDIMFLSSTNGQASVEFTKYNGTYINHSIFTYYFLKGLYGMCDDYGTPGIVTYEELKDFVQSKVKKFTTQNQIPIIKYTPKNLILSNPIMAKIDTNLLAEAKLDINIINNNGIYSSVNNPLNEKGLGVDKFASIDSSNLYNEFLNSLKKGILWGNNSATDCFNKLELESKDTALIKIASNKLIALLLDSVQNKLNLYYNNLGLNTTSKDSSRKKNNDYKKYFSSKKTAEIFDTIFKISEKYFPLDKENFHFLQQYKYFKGLSIYYKYRDKNNVELALNLLLDAYAMDTNNTCALYEISNLLESLDRTKESFTFIQKALTKYPSWDRAWNLLGIIYFDQKKYDSALYCYNKALQLNNFLTFPLINIGNYYNDIKKDYKKAIAYYKQALKMDSTYSLSLTNQALSYWHLNQFELSKKSCFMALKIDSNYAIAWKRLGDVYKSMKKYDSTLLCYNRAIASDSSNGNSWNDLGNFYFNQKKYKEAIEIYQKGLQFDENYSWLWINLGSVYTSIKKYDSAEYFYNRAINVDSNNSNSWRALAEWYDIRGDGYNALICAKKAISVDSNNADCWHALGVYLSNHNLKNYQDAVKACKFGLKIDSNYIELWISLGGVYESLEKYDSALICYRKALMIDSNNSNSWKKTGDLFKTQNKYDSALNCYNKRTKLFSTSDKEDMIIRGDYYSLFNIDSAVYFYKNATQLDSSSIDDWLMLANFFSEIKYIDSSIYYFKWIENNISPKNNRDSFRLSVCWYNLGNDLNSEDTSEKILDKRKLSYKSAIKYYPQNNEALINLSIVYLDNKQFDSCIQMLNQAYLIDSNFVMLWINYANFYETYSNDQTNYISCMKRALLYINMYPVYSKMKERICKNLGYSYYFLNDFDSSKHYYKLGLQFLEENFGKDNKYDSEILNMLGYCNLKLNRKDSAAFYFKRYIEKYPKDDNAYDSYGEFLNAIKKYDESIKEYEKAIAINPYKKSSLEALKDLYKRKGNIKKADEIILKLSKLKN